MSGMEAYQRMSVIRQGKDRDEKVLVGWLHELGFIGARNSITRLLEEGALKHDNYAMHSAWISSCTPTDLRSQHPEI
ncbi:hypothetical protein BOTBODRAFT_56270 [Botryobasidium botryosum FD-172 SS1]|uniref:Uncharacterized protein n=1 Tax=Botryobasidium botryosum (strain FD-172 SS1) TaxID=930990 RepID=A0A067MCC0_BOTB1|nr:hypothetical protein BOTBODRAFT_56270 [Botryobasidium botryosum FD-172 SS1]